MGFRDHPDMQNDYMLLYTTIIDLDKEVWPLLLEQL